MALHVDMCAHLSLGCILAQLLVPHEELLPLPEGLADGVALIDCLDGGRSDVLDGCYGQSAVLQHELSHLAVPSQQGVIQRGVPAQHQSHSYICFSPRPPPVPPACPHLSSVCSM